MQNKNIFRTIFSIIFSVGLAVFISISSSDMFTNLFAVEPPMWFKIIFGNVYFLFIGIKNQSILNYLASFGISIVFVALGILFITIGYKKINSNLLSTNVKGKPKAVTYNPSTVKNNLLRKEFATFFNNPVYCVNGLMGLIMAVVVMAMSIIMYNSIGTLPEVKTVMTAMMAFGVAMCTGIAPTTAVSISMEGSKFQNLKALPVQTKDIAWAKCMLNIILSFPIMFACAILFGVVMQVGWLLGFLILAYLLISSTSQTVLGLILNLRFPRLNWSSETQAAKSGVSMVVTMFVDIIVSVFPMALFFALYFKHSWIILSAYLAICLIVQAIYMLCLIIVLKTNLSKMYNKIQV